MGDGCASVAPSPQAPHVHGNDARGAYLVYDVALSEVRMGLPLEAAALVPFLGVLVVRWSRNVAFSWARRPLRHAAAGAWEVCCHQRAMLTLRLRRCWW